MRKDHWLAIANTKVLTPADFRTVTNGQVYRIEVCQADKWVQVQRLEFGYYVGYVPWQSRFLWRVKRHIRKMIRISEQCQKERQWTITAGGAA